MKRIITLAFTILLPFLSFAQNGTIRGTVIDDATGEGIIGGTVLIQGTSTGTSTDFDGTFSFDMAEGVYALEVSYVGYQTLIIQEVIVINGEVALFDNIRLVEASMEMTEIIVTARAVRNSEAALLTIKKNSTAMIDGISASQIRLTGDGNAVEAAKRVTGVSIEGGKYVYVRGLGDRYSKTTLNGVDIPGLDPDRNTVQMDIFPTNLIDNMIVSKNFTAELPADFTGGLLNIETKDFPEERIMSASLGFSYTPGMNLNPDYLGYEGGATDFLGFDDGTRKLPSRADNPNNIPQPFIDSDQEVSDFIRSFDPELGADRKTAPLDISANFSMSDQISLNPDSDKNQKLGYIFSATYKADFNYYDDLVNAEYQRNLNNPNINELRYATVQDGQMGEKNILVGLLGGIAYKNNQDKYRLTVMRLQNGESRATIYDIDNSQDAVGQSGYFGTADNLEYFQRSLTNVLVNGSHQIKDTGWSLDWRVSPTLSTAADPDIRRTAFTLESGSGNYVFNAGAGGDPARIWRSLNEWNIVGKVDAKYDYKASAFKGRLKTGISHTFKYRDYEILSYFVNFPTPQFQQWPNNDPEQVMNPSNLFPNEPNRGFIITDIQGENPNEYQANTQNTGVYVSNEFNFDDQLKVVLGLRGENFVLRHTGRNQDGSQVLDNDKVLSSFDLFPSANFIYSLVEDVKLRAAYSRTIARPSFKELSFAQILDPVSNRTFNGGLAPYIDPVTGVVEWDGNLRATNINNLDLRAEYFPSPGEIASVSMFYKRFDNAIELVRSRQSQTGSDFQPRNVGTGNVFGFELEGRKKMGFISESLQNLSLSANFTWALSSIDMTDNEYQGRLEGARTGQNIDRSRQMAGQSPYVINAGISYNEPELGLDLGVFYNVKGNTLTAVGNGLYPDVYDQSFHNLSLSLMKKMGLEQKTTLEIKVANLLNDRFEREFESYEAENQTFNAFSPGVTFSIGMNHKF